MWGGVLAVVVVEGVGVEQGLMLLNEFSGWVIWLDMVVVGEGELVKINGGRGDGRDA